MSENNDVKPDNCHPCQRIVQVAEQLFAEKGFENTSVRGITTAAQCNLAAVNYHFGSKDKLYLLIFQQHMDVMREKRISAINELFVDPPNPVTIEQLLDAFCHAFVHPFITDQPANTRIRLMMQELQNPHLPGDKLATEVIIPVTQALAQAILKIYPDLNPLTVTLCIQSVVNLLMGQMMPIIHKNPMSEHLRNIMLPGFDLEKNIQHIVHFAAAGIKSYTEENKNE
ncbi:MAG: TetR/AcrR family transcriptional regulator [Planctomycetes bacterium]|nr:TetR/AcrR family transcriptional regulator [Planctomycetota bacterium]